MRKVGAAILAGLLVAAVPAAAQHGGGGFHNGGGFHGGGFHGGGFHSHPHFFHPFFLGGGFFPVVPYAEPFYGYPPPSAWYCANPPGYYPYVAQCAVPWQAVPVPQ